MEDIKNLVEQTTSIDIADTDQNLSIESMYQQTSVNSLAYQVCSVATLTGPTGGLFNIKREYTAPADAIQAVAQVVTATPVAADSTTYTLTINGIDYSYTSGILATVSQITAGLTQEINVTETNGSVPVTATDNGTSITLTADVAGTAFTVTSTGAGTINLVETTPNQPYVPAVIEAYNIKVIRKDVSVLPFTPMKIGITKEAIQDIRAQFGIDGVQAIVKSLKGLANETENVRLLSVLNTNAKADVDLQLTDSLNAEVNLFEITQRVHELILKMNQKTFRTYESFCILPAAPLGGLFGLKEYSGAEDKSERGLFITQIGKTKFYLNPDVNSTTAYVGLRDSVDSGRSSLVFSPYQNEIFSATNPDTGEDVYFITDRFAITVSPLHELNNEMLYKFNVLV